MNLGNHAQKFFIRFLIFNIMTSNDPLIPAFLKGNKVLVPLKIDLTYKGARFVDTFCWDLHNPVILPEEFVARTCADLNFPPGFQQRITMQIQEQLDAYKELITSIHKYASAIPNWNDKVSQVQAITIGVRHGTIDFSDKVDWDPMSDLLTPEEFASITCGDLGLPTEIEPAIAHKIRETLFRWIISILQHPNSTDTNIQMEFKVADTKATLVQGSQAVDMVTNLWKRAKPNSLDEMASVPQPQLPQDKESNLHVWLQPRPAPVAAAVSMTVPAQPVVVPTIGNTSNNTSNTISTIGNIGTGTGYGPQTGSTQYLAQSSQSLQQQQQTLQRPQ